MANLDSSYKYSPTPLHYLLFVLQHKSDELLGQKAGTSLSHVRIMSVLHGQVARSQKMVAMHLHQTEANVSRQLQVMKRQALVSVKKNKKDGRQSDVMLTSKGKKTLAHAEKALNQQHKQLLGSMSKRDSKAFDSSVKNLLKSL